MEGSSIKIAELFVDLGVKGDGPALKALGGVKGALVEIQGSAFAAKAAIIGALYAFERMTAASAQTGMNLKQFQNAFGGSVVPLQNLQNAMIQFGVSADETQNTVEHIKNSITDMFLGKGSPESLALISQYSGGLDQKRLEDYRYVVAKMEAFAKNAPLDAGRNLLANMGASSNFFGALRNSRVDLFNNNLGPVLSDSQTAKLAAVQTQWLNFANTVKHAMDQFTIKNGGQIIKDIQNITTSILDLVNALLKLDKTVHIFEALGDVIKGAADTIREFTGWLNGTRNFWGEDIDKTGKVKGDHTLTGALIGAPWNANLTEGATKPKNPYDIIAGIKPIWSQGSKEPANQTITTTVINHGVKDAKDAAGHFKKAVQDAGRQLGAQTGGF